MPIIKNNTRTEIDLDEIKRGTLIWAKHRTWECGIGGVVSTVNADMIFVRFLPKIQNVRNHYVITAKELEKCEWQVRYSSDDLMSINTFGSEEEEETDGSE